MIQSIFHWLNNSALADLIRSGYYTIPILEIFHIFGLTLLLGPLTVINLRLLGAGLRSADPNDLARQLKPFWTTGLCISLLSGALILITEADKCYESGPFRIKMSLLVLAIVFQFTVGRRTRARGPFVAIVSMLLWFGVGWAGRAIGFF